MSLRRVPLCDADSVLVRPQSHTFVAPTGATISDQLGMPNAGPAKPYVPFKPQHPTPQRVGNVVNQVFGGYDAEPVDPALPNWPAPMSDTEGIMSDALAKAKAKANQAVLKGKELAGKAAKAGASAAKSAAEAGASAAKSAAEAGASAAKSAASKTKSAAKSAASAASDRLSRMAEDDSDSDAECDGTNKDKSASCTTKKK
jgi:hypothetical protein